MLRRWWKTVDYGRRGLYYGTGKLPANCRHVTRGLYITSSGAAALPLSFLQLQILVYRQSNCTDLRDPLAVLMSRLTESLTPQTPINYGYKLVIINRVDKTCLVCAKAGKRTIFIRSSRRKPLHKLLYNSVARRRKDLERPKRTPRTKFGCRLYRIPLC